MNNKALIVLVIVLTIAVSSLGGYIIYDNLNPDEESPTNQTSPEEILTTLDYNSGLKLVLYNYLKSENKNLNDYVTSLNNNQKLYLGGISEEKNNFKDIEKYIKSIFGSNLNIEAKDYYIDKNDNMPLYKYNKGTGLYEYNEEYPASGDTLTDLGNTSIFNYKVKDIKQMENQFIITFYGLYEVAGDFYSSYTNEKGFTIQNNPDYTYDELVHNFEANVNKLMEFKYTYKKVNGNYFLTDFKAK